MRGGDGDDRAGHAVEKYAGTLLDLEGHKPGFEAFGLVLHEARPQVRAGNDRAEGTHHLAAVAHAQGKGVLPHEEGGKLGAGAVVEENALGPALAAAEHVAVTEAAAGDQAAEIFEGDAAAEDVGHVDVDGPEAGAGEGGGHLDFAVHALLAQHGDRWFVF